MLRLALSGRRPLPTPAATARRRARAACSRVCVQLLALVWDRAHTTFRCMRARSVIERPLGRPARQCTCARARGSGGIFGGGGCGGGRAPAVPEMSQRLWAGKTCVKREFPFLSLPEVFGLCACVRGRGGQAYPFSALLASYPSMCACPIATGKSPFCLQSVLIISSSHSHPCALLGPPWALLGR